MHDFNTQKLEVLCFQEHRMIHDEPIKHIQIGKSLLVTASAWKNEVNASIGGVRMVLSNRTAKSLVSAEKHFRRIMSSTLAGNQKTTIITVYRQQMRRRLKKRSYSTRN